MNMYRGDIFYTENTVGNETPVIIITPNDVLEKNPDYVYTILMTTKEKDQSPTHVEVMCKVPSVALCERIYGTNVERIGEYIRSCTEEEMQRIDEAIMLTLGITEKQLAKEKETSDRILAKFREETERYNELEREKGYGNDKEYIRAIAERDVYKSMYMNLLERKMNG